MMDEEAQANEDSASEESEVYAVGITDWGWLGEHADVVAGRELLLDVIRCYVICTHMMLIAILIMAIWIFTEMHT